MALKKYFFALCLILSISSTAHALDYILQGIDVMTTVNRSVRLAAKLERDLTIPFRPDIKGAKIEFFLEGKKLGEGITNNEGVASITIDGFAAGTHYISAQGPKGSLSRFLVEIADSSTPIFVTDIDHTISDISVWEFLFIPVEKIPELPGASIALNQLSQDYSIYYLTARDDFMVRETKHWLDFKDFPVGAVAFWDFSLFSGQVPRDHGAYKELMLSRLTDRFKNVLVGVGDRPHDVAAYRKFGMRAYYIGKLEEGPIAEGSIIVTTWQQVLDHLEANPIGTLAGDPDFSEL
jgi:hypothetical protein